MGLHFHTRETHPACGIGHVYGQIGKNQPGGNLSHGRTMMPQKAWSKKRERQYDQIKKGLLKRGESEDTAEEIAARTVNKARARAGEAKEASRLSLKDISSGRRGGLRSHSGPKGRTRDQLYEEAKDRNIRRRSEMTKPELKRAVGRKKGGRAKR
jgi:hypothetical protein